MAILNPGEFTFRENTFAKHVFRSSQWWNEPDADCRKYLNKGSDKAPQFQKQLEVNHQ